MQQVRKAQSVDRQSSVRIRPLLFGVLCALTAGVAQPVRAVGFGDFALQSYLGQPLRAKVALTLAADEVVDSGCLSLGYSDSGNPEEFITQAALSLQTDGKAILIRGTQPLNRAFARLMIQVKCPGQGSFNRTFTLLPEVAPTVESATTEESVSTAPRSRWVEAAESASPRKAEAPAALARPRSGGEPVRPISRPVAPKNSGHSNGLRFELKLSSNGIDTSRIGKLSEAEREQLRAQARRLDTGDDQTANILALQHQVQELQAQLGEMRSKLGMTTTLAEGAKTAMPPVVNPPASAPDASVPLTASAAQSAASAPAARPRPPRPASQPVAAPPAVAELPDFTTMLALGLGGILLLLLGLRYYQQKLKARWTGEDIGSDFDSQADLSPAVPVAETEPVPAAADHSVVAMPAVVMPDVIAPPPQAEAAPAGADATPEIDPMIEEAELYAVHGHPELAIKILTRLVEQSPEKSEAWMLLLSIYSSLERSAEFEVTARQFAELDGSEKYWSEVQVLGHRIDQNNPLYMQAANQISLEPASPSSSAKKFQRRPIGGILLDIGALTEEDLVDALANFHPQRDGRIGGFLIARGLISNEQLEQALEVQREHNARQQLD